jgi:MscS family membrane protein
LTNVFGAITIVLNKPFRIGDFVKIENTTWTVKDIWISYLTIIDKSGHQVMIPNEAIMTSFVENYSVRENRRVDFVLWLDYKTSEKKLKKAVKKAEEILQIYEESKDIAKFRVNFDNFWEYSLDIKITYFSLNDDYQLFLKEKEEINLKIKKSFKKEKINIAFPTRHIVMEKEK